MAAVMVVVTAVVMGAMMGAVIACASRALEAVRCPRWRVPPSSRDSSASVASRGRSPRRASRKILNTRVRRDVARRSRRRLRHGCGSQRARAHSHRILRRTIRRHSGGGRRGTQRESERHARLERVEGPAPSERSESRGPAPSERSESRRPFDSLRSLRTFDSSPLPLCHRAHRACHERVPAAAQVAAGTSRMEPGGFAPPSRYVLPIASTSVSVLSFSSPPSAHGGRQTVTSPTEVSSVGGQAAPRDQPGFFRG